MNIIDKIIVLNNGNSVLVIKSDKAAFLDFLNKKTIKLNGTNEVLMLVIGQQDDISVVTEQQMNGMGWYKKK